MSVLYCVHLKQWFPNFFSSWPLGSWSTLAVAPSFKTSNELENRKKNQRLSYKKK